MLTDTNHTILVVDDFESIRKVIADTLHRHGFQTIGAKNGKDALEILEASEKPIDLILSDFNMPVMNGFDLLKKVKSNETLKKHPFILLTSEASTEKKKLAKEAGLDAWIEKPYKIDTFISLIKYNIAKRKQDVSI